MMLVIIAAIIIYLVSLFIFANTFSGKKSNPNLNSVSSEINSQANADEDFPEEFIEFLKNNINETNRYKIKNNIYE